MKNFEKFASVIAKLLTSCDGDEICPFLQKVLYNKQGYCCEDYTCEQCEKLLYKWLLEEYKPEIDWLKVPVDTPVMVRDYDDENWKKRYFCCYLPNSVNPFITFNDCDARFNAHSVVEWRQCKLADGIDGVDPTPFLKEV